MSTSSGAGSGRHTRLRLRRPWEYDVLGNFKRSTHNADEVLWDTAFDFSEPGGTFDVHGDPISWYTWDDQGRLVLQDYKKDVTQYFYDGASRLQRVQAPNNTVEYGYDVDNNIVFEDHSNGTVFRFGTWRHDDRDHTTLVKPLPQIALRQDKNGFIEERWVFLEPDGHALESDGSLLASSSEKSFEVLGAYGRTLEQVGSPLPIDGFHGAEEDSSVGVVQFGVRHTLENVGMWLQPEPLLYLAPPARLIAHPRDASGVYSAGNPLLFADRSGFSKELDALNQEKERRGPNASIQVPPTGRASTVPDFIDGLAGEETLSSLEALERVLGGAPVSTLLRGEELRNEFASGALDHILAGNIESPNSRKPKAVGFHLESSMPDDVRITRTWPENSDGVYYAIWEREHPAGSGVWVRKTTGSSFFPSHWGEDRVAREISEARTNSVQRGRNPRHWAGVSSSGLEIWGEVNGSNKITAAWPYWDPSNFRN